MFFSGLEHERNFEWLVRKFNCENILDYKSACYIVSHPEIFRKVNWQHDYEDSSPVAWFFGDWNDEENVHEESGLVSKLSSAYGDLARLAVDLFTGRQQYFDITTVINWDEQVFHVFVQSLKIRRHDSFELYQSHQANG